MIENLTTETVNFIYKEFEKPNNKKQITKIINHITNIAFEYMKPYLYTIMAILIMLFIMNCFQFYYYIKLIILKDKTLLKVNFEDIISKN
jgi:hypothetical protein